MTFHLLLQKWSPFYQQRRRKKNRSTHPLFFGPSRKKKTPASRQKEYQQLTPKNSARSHLQPQIIWNIFTGVFRRLFFLPVSSAPCSRSEQRWNLFQTRLIQMPPPGIEKSVATKTLGKKCIHQHLQE